MKLKFLSCICACFIAVSSIASAEPITMTDMQGRKIKLAEPVKKSISIPMPAASLFISLDKGSDHLAGMHPDSYQYIQQGILSRIFPDALRVRRDITRSGFAPNVETLLEIGPDLVWQWGHMGNDLVEPLYQAGLPVAVLLYGDEQRTREWIRLMGAALGKPQRAQQFIDWREKTEQSIRAITDRITMTQRPRVLYLSRYRPNYRVAGKNTSFDLILHWLAVSMFPPK